MSNFKIDSRIEIPEVIIEPLQVKVINGNFDEAFKKFRSLVQKEGIINQYKERMAYEKPSVKRRRKARQAWERKMVAESHERLIVSGEWDRRQKKKEQKRQQKQHAKSQEAQNSEKKQS